MFYRTFSVPSNLSPDCSRFLELSSVFILLTKGLSIKKGFIGINPLADTDTRDCIKEEFLKDFRMSDGFRKLVFP